MIVSVHLHSTLQRQTSQGLLRQMQVELPEGSSLAELMRRMEIIADPDDLLLVVNGRVAETNQVIFDNDEVHFIPAISGGR